MSDDKPVADATPAGTDVSVDDLKATVERLTKENQESQNKLKEAITERQAAKAKAREEADKAVKEALAKGEHEKVIEVLTAEKTTREAELERLKKVEEEHVLYLDKQRNALLEKIPEKSREKFKSASLEILETVVSDLLDETVVTHSGKPASKNVPDEMPWDKMTLEQQRQWSEGKNALQISEKIRAKN